MTRSPLDAIRRNIARSGHHAYLILGTSSPRYLYTIGLTEAFGTELVFAGGFYYSSDDVDSIVRTIAPKLKHADAADKRMRVTGMGLFALQPVRKEWIGALMLGALDYYRGRDIAALQILPENKHSTLDVPDMTLPFDAPSNRAWRYFDDPWPFDVPADSTATTNLAALRGSRVTEAARWEPDEWELFAGAGPDVKHADARAVPLGVLLGLDPSLKPITKLEVGQALWRDDSDGPWNDWRRRGSQ